MNSVLFLYCDKPIISIFNYMLKKVLISALIMNVNYTLISDGLYDVYSKAPGLVVFAVGTGGLALKSVNAGNNYSGMNVGTSTLYSVFSNKQ